MVNSGDGWVIPISSQKQEWKQWAVMVSDHPPNLEAQWLGLPGTLEQQDYVWKMLLKQKESECKGTIATSGSRERKEVDGHTKTIPLKIPETHMG